MANPKALLTSIGKRARQLGLGQDQRLDWLEAHPVGVHLESILAVRGQDWAGLAQLASRWRAEAESDLAGIGAQRAEVLKLTSDISRLKGVGAERWIVPTRRADWPQIRAHMEAEGQRQGLSVEEVRRRVDAFKSLTWTKIAAGMKSAADHWSEQLDQAAISRFRALAAADLTDAIVLTSESTPGGSSVSLPQARAAMAMLIDRSNSLKQAFVDGEPRQCVLAARAMGRAAQAGLPRLARTAGRVSQGSVREHAIALGNAIRLSLISLSVARLAAWAGGWLAVTNRGDAWQTAARKLRSTAAPLVPRTEIRTLLQTPARFDGRSVQLEGSIVSIQILHRRGKAYSTAILRDEHGAEVQLGVAHIKIDSGGLVPGAHVIARGMFHRKHKDFAGAVIVIAQRNKSSEGRIQWAAWLQSEAASLIAPVPHGLDIETSWMPGRNGAANLLRYGVWSSVSSGSVL